MTNPIDQEELELRRAVEEAEKAVAATRFVPTKDFSIEAVMIYEAACIRLEIAQEDLDRYLHDQGQFGVGA